jgi:uncharacterized membrane protein
LPESSAAQVWAALHYLPPLVLTWLAFAFGRTLRDGAMPLIERIARQGNPALSEALCRYTRRLTAIWCAYFAIAAIVTALASMAYALVNAALWTGTVVLFVGERWIRPWLFPGEVFPGLMQQLRDTWSVWRTRG